MTLLEYIKILDDAQLKTLASRCSTSVGQLKQVAYGNRRANAALSISIDRHSGSRVTCESLRPDIDWQYLRTQAPANHKVENAA